MYLFYFQITMVVDVGRGSRFDRCLTPMGTVPISVIYGFNYPVGEGKRSKSPPSLAMATPKRGTAMTSTAPAWPSSLSTFRNQVEV